MDFVAKQPHNTFIVDSRLKFHHRNKNPTLVKRTQKQCIRVYETIFSNDIITVGLLCTLKLTLIIITMKVNIK